MADCATQAEAEHAQVLGFDVVGTTLSGYTAETLARGHSGQPDFDLLKQLVQSLTLPIILEGRIWEPSQVTFAFELGAHAVVIGSAITRPQLITKRFVEAIPTLRGIPSPVLNDG
jgi:N-acylglucosamine-6-phosphate 2-epimerase